MAYNTLTTVVTGKLNIKPLPMQDDCRCAVLGRIDHTSGYCRSCKFRCCRCSYETDDLLPFVLCATAVVVVVAAAAAAVDEFCISLKFKQTVNVKRRVILENVD